jgi:ABC-type branched-subunit amino acid transport system substrate-binding protein
VQKLVGTYYLEARQRELDELAKQRAELKITKRNRKTAKYFDLPPIVDFDAVFIPDEPKVVGQILPTFAYLDVDQMQFLGISTWHSKELVTRAQAFAEGALFVDGFHAASESREVRTFVERYRSTFGQEPGAIEALAYDAARMIEKIVTEDRPSSRSELVERLRAVKRFPGVTGTIDYRDGRLSRGLTVFTVQKGEMVEANK